MNVETDSDSWSTTTTVDDGTLTGISVTGHRVRLATVSDTLVTDKVGGDIDVTKNDVLQDELALQTDLHRVWWNAPLFNMVGSSGLCSWSWNWFAGYGEAPQTNDWVYFDYRIERWDGLNWVLYSEENQSLPVPNPCYEGPYSWGTGSSDHYKLVKADIYTPDGWKRQPSYLPIVRSCV